MSNSSLGAASIALGFAAAACAIVIVALGLAGRRPSWFREARLLTWVMMFAATAGVVVMERALITRDFTVGFVAEHGSHQTPALFNVATDPGLVIGALLATLGAAGAWGLCLAGLIALALPRPAGPLPEAT